MAPDSRAAAPAGASACDQRAGDSVAAVLGVAAGAVCHVLSDIFYIVPVELLWPLPHKFSYPLLLPARELFTPRLYKCVSRAARQRRGGSAC